MHAAEKASNPMFQPNDIDAMMDATPAQGYSAVPVERQVVEDILDVARRAPSGVNTQPWTVFVLQGPARARLVEATCGSMPGLLVDGPERSAFWQRFDTTPGTTAWPSQDPAHAGDAWLTAALALAAHDPARAQDALARYFRFFDAPLGLMFTISSKLGAGSVLDYGMFLQNIRLAARARGIQAVLQTGWRGLGATLLEQLGAPADHLLVAGMAMGYPDAAQAALPASVVVPSVPEFTTWHT